MESIQILNEVIEQSKKNMSGANRDRAVLALKRLAESEVAAETIAEYLVKLHYIVSQLFFEGVIATTSDERLSQIVDAFIANEQFRNSKSVSNIRYPKGFVSVLSLLKIERYKLSFSILSYILSQAEENGVFNEGCKNSFIKFIINNAGLVPVENLMNAVQDGKVECTEREKKRLSRFLDAIQVAIVANDAKKKERVPPKTEPTEIVEVSEALPKTIQPVNQDYGTQSNEAINKIGSLQTEILNLLRKLSDDRTAIDALSKQLTNKDSEIIDVRTQRDDKEQRLKVALEDNNALKAKLAQSESDVSDLTGRLRTSLSMDEISKNQEINTLKNDISEALKLDYSDFMGTKDNEHNADLFDMYRSTLSRIFKLLKRYGIACE